MNREELVRRVQVYIENGMTPEQVAERLWDTLLSPALGTIKRHNTVMHELRKAGEEDLYIRNKFRNLYLDNFGFLPGEDNG